VKIRELLSDESKWTKGASTRDVAGRPVNPLDTAAVCWCLDGAAEKCAVGFNEYRDVMDTLAEKLKPAPYKWNDAKQRSFADVRLLVEKLDI